MDFQIGNARAGKTKVKKEDDSGEGKITVVNGNEVKFGNSY